MRKMMILVVSMLFVMFVTTSFGQKNPVILAPTDKFAFNTPPEITACLQARADYKLSDRINPFYLRGDFDGDGKQDYAVLVVSEKQEPGIAICRGGMSQPNILGAGM